MRAPDNAGRWVRSYHPGFGWPSLLLIAIGAVVSCAFLLPREVSTGFVDRILYGLPPVLPRRPVVLVVSGRASDESAVLETVQPRGYTVRRAATAEAGLRKLRREANRIGIVVLDGDLAGAERIASEAKTACPNARVVEVSGTRAAGEIARRLMDAGVN